MSFAEGNNDFALAMYGQMRREEGNLFFSPFSIRIALCMTQAGARRETAAEMKEALGISLSDEELHVAFARIIQRLNAAGGGAYEMAVANSLWAQDGAPLLPDYLDLIARHYEGGLNLVDFRRAAETARVTINQWVEARTRQKIQQLIPSGALNADTRLVLVNAVYFKGMWVLKFRAGATRNELFYLEGGGSTKVPLMYQEAEIGYVQAKGYQAVELAYQGGDLSMLVFLPDKKNGLPELETRFSVRELNDCTDRMRERRVKLFLPRFRMTWGAIDLRPPLDALGMRLALTRFRADFSGINGHEPPHEDSLYISAVFHKAFVEVNEEGTEAAAATAVAVTRSMSMTRPPPVPVFRADHPYLIAIRDRKSGAILFLGRVANPSRES
jgi:serpin B